MDSRSCRIALLVLCAVMGTIKVQEVPVEDEYLRKSRVYETIQPVGDVPLGGRLNLYTGDPTFSHADVPLPGNGPNIALARQLVTSAEGERRLQPHAIGGLAAIHSSDGGGGKRPSEEKRSGTTGRPRDSDLVFGSQSIQAMPRPWQV